METPERLINLKTHIFLAKLLLNASVAPFMSLFGNAEQLELRLISTIDSFSEKI